MKLFEAMDTNGDGKIDVEECKKTLTEVNKIKIRFNRGSQFN